jgi:dienelactone hydrolase
MSESLPARTSAGVILAGLPSGGEALQMVAQRYVARGFTVAIAATAADDDADGALQHIAAAMARLRAEVTPPQRIAVAGYGAGGLSAFLAVTRLAADAAVSFCGVGIERHLTEARGLTAPLGLHFADDDPAVPPPAVRAIKGALEGFAMVEIYRYPTFDPAASDQAQRRAFALLDTLCAP